MRSFRKVLGSVVGLILASILTSTFAFAQHAAKGDNGANGQTAAVDKQTGKLRQLSADEAKELLDGLAPLLNQSTEGLNVRQRDNGSLFVDLEGRFMSVAVAKVNADGKVEEKCVSNAGEANEFLNGEAKEVKAKDGKTNVQPALEEK